MPALTPEFIWGTMHHSTAGVNVTPATAITYRAVYSCIDVIATAISRLPVHIIDRETGGKVTDHPVRDLLDDPNEFMTWPVFIEAYVLNLCLWGNGYAAIERDTALRPTALLPLLSSQTCPQRTNNRLVYRHALSNRPLAADSMLHTLNVSYDGVAGIAPIEAARNSVGLSLALEEFASRFFSNGANVQTILELPAMSPEALADFKIKWHQEYAGLANAHRTAAAPGMKAHRIGATPEESQALESRKHQLREVAGIYRVPPHKIGDLEDAHYANIEQSSIQFREDTIAPWVVKLEAEMNRKLLRVEERRRLRIWFNLDALLRADTASRYAAHSTAVGGPFMTVNEARRLEGMQPIEGGDKLMSNLNQAPAAARSQLLYQDAATRVLTKEINAVRRAAKKHAGDVAGFKAWVESFYGTGGETGGHRAHVARAFDPIVAALQSDADTAAIADRHCTESRAAVLEAFKAGQPGIDELLARWTAARPKAIATEMAKPAG